MHKSNLTVRSGFMASIVPEAKKGPFILTLDDGNDNIIQALDFATKHGVDVVDLLVSSSMQIDYNWLNNQLSDRGLIIGALGSGGISAARKLFFTHPAEDNRKRAVQAAMDLLEIGAYLGEGIPIIIGSMQGQHYTTSTRQTHDGENWPLIEQAHEFLADCLMPLGERAFQLGLPLIYEVLNTGESNLFTTLAEADEFVQGLGYSSIQFLLDSYHWLCQGWTIEQVKALKTKVGYAHIVGLDRKPASMGNEIWQKRLVEYAQALKAIDYRGNVIAECLPIPDADQAMASTMQWLEANFAA